MNFNGTKKELALDEFTAVSGQGISRCPFFQPAAIRIKNER